ncbi:MAG TPA: fumarylacetoacetate hydrolase family protein [Candidatus Limnocylindria bacterium]|nr:fumarylacetoacetate hydrolase family protein [Candidatus Limnocylindria bacterium]
MKLATYEHRGRTRVGAVDGDRVVPVADDMVALIASGPSGLDRARATARGGADAVPLADVRLLAPIPRPERSAFCVGWNYSEHFAEGKLIRGEAMPPEVPEWPALFDKGPQGVIGPDAGILFPAPHSEQLDWECELAVVIGREGRDIAEDRALDHVFGYTCANDVSVRDVQRRHGGQWFKGKNFDTHLPLGPWIVTADEAGDPHALRIGTRVNGVTKQDSNTRHMVFRIPRIIRDLSAGMALRPGDLILTGTPEGVGFARKPPEFLRVGDVVEVEIEKIGVLRNTVVHR